MQLTEQEYEYKDNGNFRESVNFINQLHQQIDLYDGQNVAEYTTQIEELEKEFFQKYGCYSYQVKIVEPREVTPTPIPERRKYEAEKS
jgi:hypothetical protein